MTPFRWWPLLLAGCAGAAEPIEARIARAVATVPAERRVAGDPARAEALAAITGDLGAEDRAVLRCALAEAWLDAGDPLAAARESAAVLKGKPAAAVRDRAALAWIAAWSQRQDPAVIDLLEPLAGCPPRIRARALAARAQRNGVDAEGAKKALAEVDQALQLLTGDEADQRVPLYVLRLTLAETAGLPAEAQRAYITEHRADPALGLATAGPPGTAGVAHGTPAPPLALPRVDGHEGTIDLATLRGHPVLLAVVASWSEPSTALLAGLSAGRQRWKQSGVEIVALSIDGSDSMAALPAWATRHAGGIPLIGDGLGWDGEAVAAWKITAVPQLALIAADGSLVRGDLAAATAAEVTTIVDGALKALEAPPATVAPAPTPATEVIP